jgi:pimeloyl-ACP methyl ester carboxylesterase
MEIVEQSIAVPGATLHYKMQGTGPVLLVLLGGDGDADSATQFVKKLAERFTVITHDRRGLSRSSIDDETREWSLRLHAEDAHHLLKSITDQPAYVFGTSIGALLGLELTMLHGEQVRVLVAHEPPLKQVLSSSEEIEAEQNQVQLEEAFQLNIGAAMRKFAEVAGINLEDREEGAILSPPGAGRFANFSFFMAHDAPAVRMFSLPEESLFHHSHQIVAAAGTTSAGRMPHQCGLKLAERLGKKSVIFPGGHIGYLTHPRAFATQLIRTLESDGGQIVD